MPAAGSGAWIVAVVGAVIALSWIDADLDLSQGGGGGGKGARRSRTQKRKGRFAQQQHVRAKFYFFREREREGSLQLSLLQLQWRGGRYGIQAISTFVVHSHCQKEALSQASLAKTQSESAERGTQG